MSRPGKASESIRISTLPTHGYLCELLRPDFRKDLLYLNVEPFTNYWLLITKHNHGLNTGPQKRPRWPRFFRIRRFSHRFARPRIHGHCFWEFFFRRRRCWGFFFLRRRSPPTTVVQHIQGRQKREFPPCCVDFRSFSISDLP